MIELQDMDVVEEVVLQYRPPALGLGQFTDWCLQHVEVTHEGTGRTFYFLGGEFGERIIK